MARSASPPEGQALPGRFGRPGGAGGTGARRQGRWPLPSEAALALPPSRAERKRPVFQWKSGPAHAGTSPRGRLSAPKEGSPCPVALGDRAVWVGPARDGRVTCPCRLGRGRLSRNAGLSGNGRSSGGRAAPLMRQPLPGTISALTTEGSTCPGWREAPAPDRGRRCPLALGDRAVWVGPARDGRGDGPCRLRRCRRFPNTRLSDRAVRPEPDCCGTVTCPCRPRGWPAGRPLARGLQRSSGRTIWKCRSTTE